MSKLLSLLLISGTFLVGGCDPTIFGGSILPDFGFESTGDFISDAIIDANKTPTPIPEGVYTGRIDARVTLRVGEEETVTTDTLPFSLAFGSGGEPLGADGRPLTEGVTATENGAILRTQLFIAVDDPAVNAFDLPVIREETYSLNQDGTLNLVVVFSGITFDQFVEFSGGGTTTLSRN